MRGRSGTWGFGILEAVLAVALLSIALAAIVPVFVSYASTNGETEIRTGAVKVAERLLDDLRQRDFGTWGDFKTDVEAQKIDTGLRTYDATITWNTGALTLGNAVDTRHVRVEVFFNDRQYYAIETVFTDFEN